MMYNKYDDDVEERQQTSTGAFKVPDRDFYRKNFSTFTSVANHLHQRLYIRSFKERRWDQPHSISMVDVRTPYGNILNPADGVCMHFLRRGFTKPQKTLFNTAVWAPDGRLVVGTQYGDLILWESESLKVLKLISVLAHKVFSEGDRIKDTVPITAMEWKHFGNLMVTGDERGTIQYCDETFRNVLITRDAHEKAVRGLSFSPLDTKLVSCSDDAKIHLWSGGREKPELAFNGHQADIKCIDWHPYRSLVASGARDTMVKLWDPKSGECVSTITGHKKQVNCCSWNMNGNWLATGSTDGLVKLYDIRVMKEIEVWRGQNSEVTRIAWHPMHESLLVSGGFNGSLVYWICGQSQTPHSIIAEAHRQSIDVLTWHPSGHMLASSSHDCIVKFWSREPPGSKLEPPPTSEMGPENLPTYVHGPIAPGSYSIPVRVSMNTAPTQSQSQLPYPGGGGRGMGMMGRGGRGGRGGDGGRKRYRDQN